MRLHCETADVQAALLANAVLMYGNEKYWLGTKETAVGAAVGATKVAGAAPVQTILYSCKSVACK